MDDPLPLRDIHLPDSVAWWPPAPGWWLLPVVVLGLILLLRWLRTRPRSLRIDKGVRLEVESELAAWQQHGDPLRLLQSLSILFKRVGMTYLPRDQVAGRSGLAWIEQVDGLAGGRRFSPEVRELLATAPYRADIELDERQLNELVSQVRSWCADLPTRSGSRQGV